MKIRARTLLCCLFLAILPMMGGTGHPIGQAPAIAAPLHPVADSSSALDITSGLVAYYSFDDATATDSSGTGNHGAIYGDPEPVRGARGAALRFDGIDDYIEVADDPSLNTPRVSVAAWVNPDDLSCPTYAEDHCIIVGQDSQYEVAIFGETHEDISPGEIAFAFSPSWRWIDGNYVAAPNEFFHVAMTFDASYKATVYVDGQRTREMQYTGPIHPWDHCLRIGARGCSPGFHYNPWAFFGGILDEVRIYDRALTAAEVQTLAQDTGGETVYLRPQDSSTTYCHNAQVEIRVNAVYFKAGQIKIAYDPTCGNVTNWTRNTAHFPMGTWDSSITGEEWITFSAGSSLTGDYKIGTLAIHCENRDKCTTALDFLVGGSGTSKLFDEWGNEVSVAWKDGSFGCTTGLCGDVAPYPSCDGQVNMGDVALLHSYVGHPGKYRLCCESSTPVAAEPFGPTETASIGFAPLHSSAPFSQTVRTEIHVNAARFKAGQIGFTYDPACADVVEWTRNSAGFPMGTWDSDTIGEEWLTFSANEALTGTYSIGSLVLHCVSEEACTTALVFLKEGTRASKLFDDWGSEISATWTDGAFSKGYNVHLPITLSGNAY